MVHNRGTIIRCAAVLACTAGVFWMHSAYAQTQLSMDEHAGQKLIEANRKLNASVAVLRKHLSTSQLALFQQSQQTWYRFRTQDALFRASQYQGGSLYPTEFAMVQTDLTNRRIAELQTIIKERDEVSGNGKR